MRTRYSAATQVVVTTESTLAPPIAPTDFAAFFRKESGKRGFEATAENTGAGAAAGILATPRVASSVALKKPKQEKSASKGKGKGAAIF